LAADAGEAAHLHLDGVTLPAGSGVVEWLAGRDVRETSHLSGCLPTRVLAVG
jgi:hypothetical protein